ncbi:MAG TPA: DUF4340 domain-containing protein [Verrucomicrobiota bacterium]|nr:DUF4340 domain-containing protein [Verrucomicrobiota bacterium]
MNAKQLTLLLVLVVVLGAAGLMVYKQQNAARREGQPGVGRKVLENLAVNEVATLVIRDQTNELKLVKGPEVWQVEARGNYPANFGEISGFLLKLRDLKAAQVEQVGASQLGRLGLATGTGTNAPTVVEFRDQAGKTLHRLYLGKKHLRKPTQPSPMGQFDSEGWPDGRYIKVDDSPEVVLVSEVMDNIVPKPEQWLAREFFKVEKARSISVEHREATNSWKVTRETETDAWKLADAKDGEALDTSKTSSLNYALNSPTFVDVLVDPNPADFGLDQPRKVTLETFDGFTYELKVGNKTNENYALQVAVSAQLPAERTPGKDEKAEDKERLDKEFKEKQEKLKEKLKTEQAFGKWTYLVAGWTLDQVLKERRELLAEKKEEPKKEEDKDEPASAAPAQPAAAEPPPPPASPKADQ